MNKIKQYIEDKENDFAQILGELIQNEKNETIKELIDVIIEEIEKMKHTEQAETKNIESFVYNQAITDIIVKLKTIII